MIPVRRHSGTPPAAPPSVTGTASSAAAVIGGVIAGVVLLLLGTDGSDGTTLAAIALGLAGLGLLHLWLGASAASSPLEPGAPEWPGVARPEQVGFLRSSLDRAVTRPQFDRVVQPRLARIARDRLARRGIDPDDERARDAVSTLLGEQAHTYLFPAAGDPAPELTSRRLRAVLTAIEAL